MTLLLEMIEHSFKTWSYFEFFFLIFRAEKQGKGKGPLMKTSELEKGVFVCPGFLPLRMAPLPTFGLVVDCQLPLLRTRILSRNTQGQSRWGMSHSCCCSAQLKISEPQVYLLKNGVCMPHGCVSGFSEMSMKALAQSSYPVNDGYCALRFWGQFFFPLKKERKK